MSARLVAPVMDAATRPMKIRRKRASANPLSSFGPQAAQLVRSIDTPDGNTGLRALSASELRSRGLRFVEGQGWIPASASK